MRHRVDPDALYGFVLNRWGHAVAAQVCPEAEPERPEPGSDRCGCAMFGYIHARKECDAYRDKPAEPVIDEAVFRAMYQAPEAIQAARDGLVASVNRELRSNACGGTSERSSSSSDSSSGGRSESTSETPTAAPAADPRRLTDAEMDRAWLSARGLRTQDPPHPTHIRELRAVADAQFEKARVTISSEDINAWYCSMRGGLPALTALLRRHGVEVTP